MVPLISVLMPVYNTVSFLPACMKSVLGQTYDHLEIILLDDGSNDGSGELCDQYAKQDCRVTVIHQSNQGVASARNALLKAAHGEWYAWIDSDDICAEDMIEYLYHDALETDADAVQCMVTIRGLDHLTSDSGKEPVYLSASDNTYLDAIIQSSTRPNLCGKLYRSDVFRGMEIPNFCCGEDSALQFLLVGHIKKYVSLPAVKYYYVTRQSSLTHSKQKLASYIDSYLYILNLLKGRPNYYDFMLYVFCHEASADLFWNHTVSKQCSDQTDLLFRMLKENRISILHCSTIGYLGRMEIRLLCTNLPGRHLFSVLCQKLFELRKEPMNKK